MAEIVYKEESYMIIGACFEVYNRLGCGFLEAVYQEALEIELAHQEIPYQSQPELKLVYRDRTLSKAYNPDFICYEKIVVEIKAVSEIVDKHRAQTLNYLNATGFNLGILVNFGEYAELIYERIAHTENLR